MHPDEMRDELPQHLVRVPPWSSEAEDAVIGALLLDNQAWDRAADILLPEMFYSSTNRISYEAISTLCATNKPADVVTVATQLQKMAKSNRVADDVTMSMLQAQLSSVPSSTSIRYYAEIVLERWQRRVLIATLDESMTKAWQPDCKPADLVEGISSELGDLAMKHTRQAPQPLETLVAQRLDALTARNEGEAGPVWTFNMPQVEEILGGGFKPGRIYLLGGRPAMGKSSLALDWLVEFTMNVGGIGEFLSLEMPKEEVTDRAIAKASQVSARAIERGRLNDREWSKVSDGVEKLGHIAMHIDDQANLTITDIRIKARYVKGLQVLVLDYVQLCAGTGENSDNRNAELGLISRCLKDLAKQLNCAILVLSALGRKVDERTNKRPLQADLRDCGQLEADADVVMALFPLRARDETGRIIRGLDIIKNRHGPEGCIALDFWPDVMSWGESEYKAEDLLKSERKSKGSDI